MTVSPTPRPIDYTLIRFPSDRIAIADIRRAHPERFDVERARQFEDVQDNDPDFHIPVIMYLERLLAKAAYATAVGDATDTMEQACVDRAVCAKELTDFYAAYGVTSGPNHTEQLIRDIEAQAVAQAVSRPRR